MPLRRPRSLVVLAAGLTVLATGGCNASAAQSREVAKSFVLVTPNPVGTNDFLRLAVMGVEAAARAQGGTSTVMQSDPATMAGNLTAAVRRRPEVIVTVGFQFDDVVPRAAERNPGQQFVLVDSCTKKRYPNVSCAVFREQEGAFLAGAEAGLLTRSKKVAVVAALDTPRFHRFSDPFGQGAKSVDPAVSFTALYVGGQNPFSDPARAKKQAGLLAAKGADAIMGAAGAGNSGIFDAAAKSGRFSAWGVDTNQCPSAPGSVVDNVIKRTDVVIGDMVRDVLAGKGGKTSSYGLAEGGVTLTGLLPGALGSQCLVTKNPSVITKVKELRRQIISGALKIDDPATG
ncbi:MAG: family transporter substrate-binding protein [Streptosporangiaceae bacterium]|jgi:basic membrane protein A|nr:family transporter substrate-binding protein [Streptosporangiaceae bacterium]